MLAFNFGGFFLLVRVISVEDFGSWSLFLSIVSALETSRYGLLRNSLIKFLGSTDKSEHGEIQTASLFLNTILTFVGAFALIAVAGQLAALWNSPALDEMLWVNGLTAIFLVLFTQFDYLHHAYMNFKAVFWPNIARKGLFFLFIVAAYFGNFELELVHLAWFQALATILAAIWSYFLIDNYLILSKKISVPWIKKQFNYGKYVVGTNLSTMLYKNIDQFMLGAMISTEAVAKYSIAVRVTNLVEVPTTAISTVVFPQSVKRHHTEGQDALRYLYEKSVGVIMALMVPMSLFILLLPQFVIWIVAGNEYADAATVLQITILYTLFVPFARQFGTILDAMGFPKINFYFTAISMILNVISNYFFINQFGLIGAAYGTLVTYAVSFVIMQLVIKRRLNVNTLKTFYYMFEFYGTTWKTVMAKLRGTRTSESNESEKQTGNEQ